jgi:hypothetical protein
MGKDIHLVGLGVGLLFRDYLTLSFGDPIVEAIATLLLGAGESSGGF